MSRDLARENADLRTKLRDVETRLRLLAAAVLSGDTAAEPLARMLLGARLDVDGVSLRPPPNDTGEPAARTLPTKD